MDSEQNRQNLVIWFTVYFNCETSYVSRDSVWFKVFLYTHEALYFDCISNFWFKTLYGKYYVRMRLCVYQILRASPQLFIRCGYKTFRQRRISGSAVFLFWLVRKLYLSKSSIILQNLLVGVYIHLWALRKWP